MNIRFSATECQFYTKEEWISICVMQRLKLEKSFGSSIRFPKKKDTAYGFDELMKKFDQDIIAGYDLEIVGNEIYVTEKVNNLLFVKDKK